MAKSVGMREIKSKYKGIPYMLSITDQKDITMKIEFSVPANHAEAGQVHFLEHLLLKKAGLAELLKLDKSVRLNGYADGNRKLVALGYRDIVISEYMKYRTSDTTIKKSCNIIDTYLSNAMNMVNDPFTQEEVDAEKGVIMAEMKGGDYQIEKLMEDISSILTVITNKPPKLKQDIEEMRGLYTYDKGISTIGSSEDITNANAVYLNILREEMFRKQNMYIKLYVNDSLLSDIKKNDSELFEFLLKKYFPKTGDAIEKSIKERDIVPKKVDFINDAKEIMSGVKVHPKQAHYTNIECSTKDTKDAEVMFIAMDFSQKEGCIPLGVRSDIGDAYMVLSIISSSMMSVREKYGILYGGRKFEPKLESVGACVNPNTIGAMSVLSDKEFNKNEVSKFIKAEIKKEIDRIVNDDEALLTIIDGKIENTVINFSEMRWSMYKALNGFLSRDRDSKVKQEQFQEIEFLLNNPKKHMSKIKKETTKKAIKKLLLDSLDTVQIMFVKNTNKQ